MANWAAIGALGTAAQGAGNYFGQVNSQKIKDDRLAQARGEFIEDRNRAEGRADQKVIDDRAYQENQKIIDAQTKADLRTANMQEDQDFKVANPTMTGANVKGDNGNIWKIDSNGDEFDTGLKYDANEGIPDNFKMAGTIQKGIAALDKRLGYTEAKFGYDKLLYAAKEGNAITDVAMVFYTMKALDPTSVVRESEFKTMAEARQWFSEYGAKEGNEGWTVPSIVASVMQKSQGDGTLLLEQREQMVALAADGFRNVEADFQSKLKPFEAQINSYGVPRDQTGIDSFDIGSSWATDKPAAEASPYDNMPKGMTPQEFDDYMLTWEADKPELP